MSKAMLGRRDVRIADFGWDCGLRIVKVFAPSCHRAFVIVFADERRTSMLPVTLQIPAAVLLVVGGAVACFAGYRFFRIVLGLYGFVLGALLATTIAGAGSTSSL